MTKKFKSDIEIASEATMLPITEVAKKIELDSDSLELYGKHKAKLTYETIRSLKGKEDGKLVLVTAISPTPAGEGKSTVTVGLSDALSKEGKEAMTAIREPSLGPVLGVKGGAAGGGYAQVMPMEEINLHFTGDFHRITSANNALAAFIDNHIQQGNELNIDPRRIVWKRVLDLNDRALRKVVIGLGGPFQGVPREDGFDITVASEIMAILCLSEDLQELQERLSEIVIGYTYDRDPVTVKDIGCEGALTLLLKDGIKPNLVQTLEHTPALVHGGPFANIAHGCNSVIATKTALKLADYVVTEAGFGADLGAEKFLDIKVPVLGKAPDCVVIVATIRALKMHGGVAKENLNEENVEALKAGFANLQKHAESIQCFGLPFVVAINKFIHDTPQEVAALEKLLKEKQMPFSLTEVWEKGGEGGRDLANCVIREVEKGEANYKRLYDNEDTIEEKLEKIVTKIYGGKGFELSSKALKQIAEFKKHGWDKYPICMAKTQYSFSDDPTLIGRPSDFVIHIREFIPKMGARFLVALTGDVMTMPGLPKKPAGLNMGVDENGNATGLF